MIATETAPAIPAFPPPGECALLYPGTVTHARLRPFGHRFAYRVFSLLIDLDRLEEANRRSLFFSVNRRNLLAFHERDHHGGNSASLRVHVDGLLAQSGAKRARRVLLLAYPRVLNFVFNPLSVYFCYDDTDRLTAAIYEVRNTFGERHTYVCPVQPGEQNDAGLRQEREKLFYVSPFMSLDCRYRFRILPPGERVQLRILETEAGEATLSATFNGRKQRLDSKNTIKNLLRMPLMTAKVVAGIHWEALKLWLKGAKFHSRPAPPPPVSIAKEAGSVRVSRGEGEFAWD